MLISFSNDKNKVFDNTNNSLFNYLRHQAFIDFDLKFAYLCQDRNLRFFEWCVSAKCSIYSSEGKALKHWLKRLARTATKEWA